MLDAVDGVPEEEGKTEPAPAVAANGPGDEADERTGTGQGTDGHEIALGKP